MKMRHPDIDALADYVSEEQFVQVWAPRGWLKVEPEAAFAGEILGRPVASLEDVKVEELRWLVEYRGFAPPKGNASRAEAEKVFLSTFTPKPATAVVGAAVEEPGLGQPAANADAQMIDDDAPVGTTPAVRNRPGKES